MDVFAPCNFANIQGYLNDPPENGIDKLPSFQGNNAISVDAHLKSFGSWVGKYARVVDYNHEDVKMRLFVLTLEKDALDWFTKKPDNSFDSLQSIINGFKKKYGDEREKRHLVRGINVIRKRENRMVEEFNKRFNVIIKEISTNYKPPDKSLLDFFIDAFNPDTSYELRRAKNRDYKVARTLAIDLEKDKKASGKSKIPGFDKASTKLKEPEGKEVKESDDYPMQNLLQKLESMEVNQAKLISNHVKEISTLQSRLIQMERAQAHNFQPRINNNNQSNNTWQTNKRPI